MGFLIKDAPHEVAELWDQYQNDPRPFPQICKEHFLRADKVYEAFDAAGYPWRQIKHPMICKECGKIFLQDKANQRYCSLSCTQAYRKKNAAVSSPDPDLLERKQKAKSKDIIGIAAEAREHGMSYGKYVAYLEGR